MSRRFVTAVLRAAVPTLGLAIGVAPLTARQARPPADTIPAAGVRARLVPGLVRRGRLERGDLPHRITSGPVVPNHVQDEWILQGVFGDTLAIEVRSTAFDVHLRVFDPEGGLISEDYTLDERRTSWTAEFQVPSTQEYRAVVSGGLGMYTIRLRVVSSRRG